MKSCHSTSSGRVRRLNAMRYGCMEMKKDREACIDWECVKSEWMTAKGWIGRGVSGKAAGCKIALANKRKHFTPLIASDVAWAAAEWMLYVSNNRFKANPMLSRHPAFNLPSNCQHKDIETLILRPAIATIHSTQRHLRITLLTLARAALGNHTY